jgi:acetyl esterase/lipase
MPTAAIPLRRLSLIACLGLVAGAAARAEDPRPTHAAIPYGPHPQQLLDVYVPEGDGPFPALIWYGRLWEPGPSVPPVKRMSASRVASVGVRTRVMKDAIAAGIDPPVSVCLLDARRALQYVRLHAAEWHLDPSRIAVAGSSQGALPALYVACAGEQADPNSSDPVERVSTKVTCAGAHRSQPTIDPRRMQEWQPGVEWGAPAFGCSFADSLRRRDELLPLIARWSPESLLSPGDPPIYFENDWGLTPPEGVGRMDYLVHSPRWALGFEKLARNRGVTCYVKYPGHPTEGFIDIWDFLARQGK